MPPIAVIAGGLATRLGALTRDTPKSLLTVAGEPFIGHQLRLFRRERIERVVLCVGHMSDQVKAYVGDGARFGLSVVYSPDGDRPVGTGGAVRQALPLLGSEFFVTYGDSYLNVPYAPIVESFRQSGKPALMTVLHNEGRWDTSNTQFADGRILDYSKSPTPRLRHIDYGLSLLKAEVFAEAPAGKFDLALLYSALVARGEMAGFEVFERFYEIGSHTGLQETDAYIRQHITCVQP